MALCAIAIEKATLKEKNPKDAGKLFLEVRVYGKKYW